MLRQEYDLNRFKETLVADFVRYLRSRCYSSVNGSNNILKDIEQGNYFIYTDYAADANLTCGRVLLAWKGIKEIREAQNLQKMQELILQYKIENAKLSAAHFKTHNNHFKSRFFPGSALAEVFHRSQDKIDAKLRETNLEKKDKKTPC